MAEFERIEKVSHLRIVKPGFHIVVSVVSAVQKFIGQIQLYGNLP